MQITLSEPAQDVKNNIDDMLSGNISQEALNTFLVLILLDFLVFLS